MPDRMSKLRRGGSAGSTPAKLPGTPRGGRSATSAKIVAGLAGGCGSLACVASMVLPLVGLAGVGVAAGAQASSGSMAGMAGTGPATSSAGSSAGQPGGILGLLVSIGPELLVASVLLVSLSLWLRRRVAAAPALVAGALLYWGMYAQASVGLMYATIVIGYLIWLATYAWTRVRPAREYLVGVPTL